MSSDYRLGLVWTSHGEQLRADLDRNIGGLTGFEKRLRGSSRELGLWGQQMRAVGTTIRYALAGATVYAVAGAVGGLAQFRDRLGEIDALAAELDDRGRLQSLGRNLNTVGDIALLTSNKFGIAVDDIQQHMVRFYSSFQGVEGPQGIDLLRDYADAMGNLTLIAEGADPQQMGGGIASLVIGATPPGRQPNIKRQADRMVDIIAQVLSETPTITGADISRDIGRLSAAQTAARMTPEQIFSVYGLAARAGGSGAVIGRGITQLLASEIIRPQTEEQMGAFRRAGLPTDPTALRQMGGWNIIMQMMRAVAPNGAQFANKSVLGLEGLSDEEAINAAGAQGINMTLASQLFGRQESFRQFLNLMANGGPQALQKFIEGVEEADRVNRGRQQAELRRDQRTLLIMQQGQRNLAITFMRGIDPILNPLARAVTGISTRAIEAGPTATAGVVGGVAAASVASRLLFGAGMFGATGQGIMKIPGVRRLAARMPFLSSLAGRAPQLASASLIGAGPGVFTATGIPTQTATGVITPGARENPLWVVIDPLSWSMPGAPTPGGGGGTGVPPIVPSPPGAARWTAVAAGLTAAGVAASPLVVAEVLGRRRAARDARRGATGGQGLLNRLRASGGRFAENDEERHIYRLFSTNRISAPEAERRLQALSRGGRGGGGVGTGMGFVQQVYGEAGLTISLEPSPELLPFLRELTNERVPVKLQPVAAGQRPQFRGKDKTRRGGTR